MKRPARKAFAFSVSFAAVLCAAGVAAQAQPEEPAAPPTDDPAAGLDAALSGGTQRPRSAVAYDDIVVVPRKAVLKGGRVELAPFTGVTVNDTLIRHFAFGVDANYYLTDVFSVGLEGMYFVKDRTAREGLVGLQYNRIATINKMNWGGALNFGYVPGYGKFSLFNRYIFHWDVFATAGIGMVQTEIIPRLPGAETFKNNNISPNFGVGARLYLTKWLGISATFRDHVFNDKFEPTNRDRAWSIDTVKDNASSRVINAMMFYVAATFFVPPSFEYKTPR